MAEKKKRPKLWFEGKEEKPVRQTRMIGPIRFNIRFRGPQMQSPAGGLVQTKDSLMLTVPLPGFRKEDINVKATSRTINISAEHSAKDVKKGENFYKEQMSSGSVRKSLMLPAEIDADNVRAKFENGMLRIVMLKKKKN